jgi:hypothetical protein
MTLKRMKHLALVSLLWSMTAGVSRLNRDLGREPDSLDIRQASVGLRRWSHPG